MGVEWQMWRKMCRRFKSNLWWITCIVHLHALECSRSTRVIHFFRCHLLEMEKNVLKKTFLFWSFLINFATYKNRNQISASRTPFWLQKCLWMDFAFTTFRRRVVFLMTIRWLEKAIWLSNIAKIFVLVYMVRFTCTWSADYQLKNGLFYL